MDFVTTLRRRCQQGVQRRTGAVGFRIAFPDSDDDRVLRVAEQLLTERAAAEVWLLSPAPQIEARAARLGLSLPSLPGCRCLPASEAAALADDAQRYTYAAKLLANAEVDAVLGGNTATTATVIRAGIRGVGLAPGVETVSGAFLMHKPPASTLLFADCGVVVAPTVAQLVDIGVEAVKTWRQLVPDVEPVVAYLSFSTLGSATHAAQAQVAAAAATFRQRLPEVAADGELQFDAAIDAEIGRRKAPHSAAAGRANCLVFPDLDAGNIGYKIAQRLGGFEAYGPILQGLAKPFNDLSRGSTVADILASAYISMLRA